VAVKTKATKSSRKTKIMIGDSDSSSDEGKEKRSGKKKK